MAIFGGAVKLLGGFVFFIGLFSFITLYALLSSGILANGALGGEIGQIINASGSAQISGQGYTSTQIMQIQQAFGNFTNENPECSNIFCFTAKEFNLNLPLSQGGLGNYEIFSLVILVLGLVVLILSYDGGDRLRAIGRGTLSVAILSFVSIYITFIFVFPALLTVPVDGLSLHIPASVTAPFTSEILLLDITLGVTGVLLIILSSLFYKRQNRSKNQANLLVNK